MKPTLCPKHSVQGTACWILQFLGTFEKRPLGYFN